MAKKLKTITAGRLVKAILYTPPEPRDGDRARAEKSRMTTAAQQAANDKTARGKLEMELAANFTPGDLFVLLTYRDADLPRRRAGAVSCFRRFIKLLRRHRAARGQELRYIYVTEGRHGSGRLHHHFVVNSVGLDDLEVIRSLWAYGDIVEAEGIDGEDYEPLALYMTKESAEGRPVGARMWSGSKNLRKPTVTADYVPNNTTLELPPGGKLISERSERGPFGEYRYMKYLLPTEQEEHARLARPRRSRRKQTE